MLGPEHLVALQHLQDKGAWTREEFHVPWCSSVRAPDVQSEHQGPGEESPVETVLSEDRQACENTDGRINGTLHFKLHFTMNTLPFHYLLISYMFSTCLFHYFINAIAAIFLSYMCAYVFPLTYP